ncbi:MAG TPA: UDP-N-acetylmuramate--L-alanine ligase [Acidimicrobiales bacterium]|nr:UDP-N-acetylmuramate--L-alanine ligase [Acidimicrobiales bacterium]
MPDAPGPLDLRRPIRVHVVGVGGAGMSAIASVLAAMGHEVTGSDLKSSPVTERLATQGVAVSIGHRAENVGSAEAATYSPAVPEDNVELVEARRLGLRVLHRAELLAAVAATRRCIAVAGTHGKTTTSSMLALVLIEAGLRPSFLVGADVSEVSGNAVWDDGEWLVVEADESYGSFEGLEPELAVLTNVEPDHLDHYGTFGALRAAFGRFVGAATGRAVVGADDPEARAIGRRHGSLTVGTDPAADYVMADLRTTRSSVGFDLVAGDERLGRIEVPVPGAHNARNAALASVAAMVAGVPFAVVVSALARFAGVPRRFEFRGETGGVTFVDDYAHLPSEVRATLAAARAGGWRRVVAVFQPHRYTRTAALADSFAGAFDDADVVVVTDVFGAGERPVPGVSGKLVADALRAVDPTRPIFYAAAREELRQLVAGLLEPGDLCCTLGAGDLTSLPDELLAAPAW